MELKQGLDFLRRRWWLLILMPLLAGLAGYFGSMQLPQVYEATTTVLVNQTQAPGVIQYNDILTSERLTSTYAQLVERRQILTQVVGRLNLTLSEERLKEKIRVSPVRNTQLLQIAAEDEDALLAAAIANTTARVFISDNAAQTGSRPGTVSIAEEADVPRAPAKPNLLLNAALAFVSAFLAAAAIALVFEYLDDTVKTARDVEFLSGLPTLGQIRRSSSRSLKGNIDRGELQGPDFWEELRQLRTSVHFSLLNRKGKTVLITSTNPGEGKTTTAIGLAMVLAQAGHSVVLIDSDLRRPSLHNWFGCANSLGVTGLLLRGGRDPQGALVKTPSPNLLLLPSGPVLANPSELLMSSDFWRVVDELKQTADYVILDSPPLLPVTDASIISAHVDATILVAECAKTRSDGFQRSRAVLAQANAKLIGVVINKVKLGRRRASYYGYRKPRMETAAAAGRRVEPGSETASAVEQARKNVMPISYGAAEPPRHG
jgi:capsular exopolysaccharide synthesis family protein